MKLKHGYRSTCFQALSTHEEDILLQSGCFCRLLKTEIFSLQTELWNCSLSASRHFCLVKARVCPKCGVTMISGLHKALTHVLCRIVGGSFWEIVPRNDGAISPSRQTLWEGMLAYQRVRNMTRDTNSGLFLFSSSCNPFTDLHVMSI